MVRISDCRYFCRHYLGAAAVRPEVHHSGGYGLLTILEGCLSAVRGVFIEKDENAATTTVVGAEMESDEFGYCTEFIIRLDPNVEKTFKEDYGIDPINIIDLKKSSWYNERTMKMEDV